MAKAAAVRKKPSTRTTQRAPKELPLRTVQQPARPGDHITAEQVQEAIEWLYSRKK